MELKGKFKVMGIKKKTSAVFFKELKVGDEFELYYRINGGYEQAPVIGIKKGDTSHSNNATQLNNNLDKFELEQVA
ncbi:hypothetical protein P4639_22270 [Priestia megaterium]|uniref:hypothetical protein n=1 Tax=Priestia megaterium TaxID=1404 RepID=UPI002E21E01E|nr:hypothetical protein [Priestia megaterium]